MSGSDTLTFNPTVEAAIAVVVVGFAAYWANPRRTINRAFFSASLHVAAWLGMLHLAVTSDEGLFWLRVTTVVGTFIPIQLWLIKDTVVIGGGSLRAILVQRRWWVAAAAILAVIPFTEWFIPGHATLKSTAQQVYGTGYHAYYVGLVAIYVLQFRETARETRLLTGVRRMELQILLIGGIATAVAVMVLMGLRAVLGLPWLIGLQPFVILTFYAGIVIAITTSRIFDARQILLVATQKFVLVATVMAAAYGLDRVFGFLIPELLAFFATTAIALWFAAALNGWLDHVFQFFPQATAMRQEAFAVARRELRVENLEKSFLQLLKGWGQAEGGLLISGVNESLSGGGVDLPKDGAVVSALKELRWATPERLARERSTPEREALAQFLAAQGLGVLVVGEGPTLTVLIGVGIPASRRPFTYPQVTQLLELASIIESALERAHFSVKAQHAEQLATVGLLGASLAHEIRNPLVTIKTFVQLLPEHHQDPVFREKFFRLIGDEVTRIDRLTEQLLDLAAPRAYSAQITDLHPVLHAGIELVAAKAADKRIRVVSDLQARPDRVFTDATAAKQVLLNLCFNAIQAVERCEGDRWIRVATRNVPAGVEMLVEDGGPGIAPEIRPRLFQPFQSTKSTGFGLGLAICSDILAGLNASIAVDPPVAGRGASFRVIFPCQPFSS
jgi:signal transduction histidine kinase